MQAVILWHIVHLENYYKFYFLLRVCFLTYVFCICMFYQCVGE